MHCLGILTSMFLRRDVLLARDRQSGLWHQEAGKISIGTVWRPDSVVTSAPDAATDVVAADSNKRGKTGDSHGIFPHQGDLPFMKYALYFNAISLITFLIAVGALFTWGLHYGIDFTGGTVAELRYAKPDMAQAARRSKA